MALIFLSMLLEDARGWKEQQVNEVKILNGKIEEIN